MRGPIRFAIRFIAVMCLISTAAAQNNRPASEQAAALSVTAFASIERVRLTAPSSIVQMRLEVYSSTGRRMFDNKLNIIKAGDFSKARALQPRSK